jgi:hypothetical protein
MTPWIIWGYLGPDNTPGVGIARAGEGARQLFDIYLDDGETESIELLQAAAAPAAAPPPPAFAVAAEGSGSCSPGR